MAEPDDDAAAERRARQLLAWATFITVIALGILALDVMIKRQILEAATDAHRSLDQIRRPGPAGSSPASSPYPGVATMGPAPAPSADPDQDEGGPGD